MVSRIPRLDQIESERKIDAFLLTSSIVVKYLTGYFHDFEIGLSPFQLIPAALVYFPRQTPTLLVADNEPVDAGDMGPDIQIMKYFSYTYDKSLNFTGDFLKILGKAFGHGTNGRLRIGIETGSVPYVVVEFVATQFPNAEFLDISSDLTQMRMIKDPDEIRAIRASTRLCDVGQESVMNHAKQGMSELELFALVRADMENAAGKRIPLMADLVSGDRTAEGGGNPSSRILKPGDAILSDLTPCLDGYWSDTCNTIIVGGPGREQRRIFHKVKETLERGLDMIKPGVRACDIDHFMREILAPCGSYSHHSGHGVGLAYHEEPRIVPYSATELKSGMVITLEPGIYTQDFGIRLENLAVVTQSGYEVISTVPNHSSDLEVRNW